MDTQEKILDSLGLAYTAFLFVLAISPIGIVLPGLILCTGSTIGAQNFACTPSWIGVFLSPIMAFFHFSFFFLIGFGWLLAAVVIWFLFLVSASRQIVRFIKPVQETDKDLTKDSFTMFRK